MDTQGKLTFPTFSTLAEFERDLAQEQTMVSSGTAREGGRVGGRPRSLEEDIP